MQFFFDANNDGYPDLYVVCGGNEYDDGNPALADHLYMNDGKGHFKESANALPVILTNKSCVAVADINKDGKPELGPFPYTCPKKWHACLSSVGSGCVHDALLKKRYC